MMLCVISYWVLSGAKWRQIQQLRCCVLPANLLKWRDVYLKLTRHNGRAGAHGTYNPKHNDRSFNLANSEHIDPERAKGNIYWDCFHGFRSALAPPDPNDLAATFSEVERQFYESRYTTFIESQNERNAKIRHTERNRSIPDLLSSRKTCPEETIYQLGTLDEHASAEDLLNIVTEFIDEFKARFGDHVHVLDWALHLDESTPHIHERHVFDCENRYGEVAPQQEKALEALGFDLPDPDKPLSRRNNRKISFDAACRKMLFEIAKRHGLELEEAEIRCTVTVDGYTDFIFVNRFGECQHQGTLNKAIRRIIRDCNDEVLAKNPNSTVLLPRFSCHTLRHTFTTRMCEAGVNIKVIQDALGHSDISTTLNIYADVTKELRKSEFENLDRQFAQWKDPEE